jgi:LysR family transcriptional regulator, glycine cleavage system transcriptional activator
MMKSLKNMNSTHESNQAAQPGVMRRLPALNMLRAFEATARHSSVTRAASELNVTQSAVSHQIKALEAWLGTPLVQREGRKIVLTKEGMDYFPSLSHALDLMAQATSRVEQKNRRNTLLVSVLSTFAIQWLIPKLNLFCAQWPQLDVQLNTTANLLDFDPAQFDVSIRCMTDEQFAFSAQQSLWHGVHTGAFLPDALTPVCAPSLLQNGMPLNVPKDLQHHTILHSRSRPLAWADWFNLAGAAQLRPANEITFDHSHLANQAACQGLGLALGSPTLLTEMTANHLLHMPFPNQQIDVKNFYWIRSPRSIGNSSADAFCAWLERAP